MSRHEYTEYSDRSLALGYRSGNSGIVPYNKRDCLLLPRLAICWRRAACSSIFNVPLKRLAVAGIPVHKKTLNSMVRVRERTIPTVRPPLVGEVIANFCG
jgi:hypothetical protein